MARLCSAQRRTVRTFPFASPASTDLSWVCPYNCASNRTRHPSLVDRPFSVGTAGPSNRVNGSAATQTRMHDGPCGIRAAVTPRPQPLGVRVSDAIEWARHIYDRYVADGSPPTMLTLAPEHSWGVHETAWSGGTRRQRGRLHRTTRRVSTRRSAAGGLAGYRAGPGPERRLQQCRIAGRSGRSRRQRSGRGNRRLRTGDGPGS